MRAAVLLNSVTEVRCLTCDRGQGSQSVTSLPVQILSCDRQISGFFGGNGLACRFKCEVGEMTAEQKLSDLNLTLKIQFVWCILHFIVL